jgi:hypothetical protein
MTSTLKLPATSPPTSVTPPLPSLNRSSSQMNGGGGSLGSASSLSSNNASFLAPPSSVFLACRRVLSCAEHLTKAILLCMCGDSLQLGAAHPSHNSCSTVSIVLCRHAMSCQYHQYHLTSCHILLHLNCLDRL